MERRHFLMASGVALAAVLLPYSTPARKYGVNVTRRASNGSIVDPKILKSFDFMNINDFNIHIGMFQKDVSSSDISFNLEGERAVPEDRYVEELIETLKSKGSHVLISPTVYVSKDKHWDGYVWRGNISSENPKLWFENYESVVMHYAAMSEKFRLRKFCVGSELRGMQEHSSMWDSLVKNVRKEFSGQLSYCANWDSYKIPFADALDYFSISAYFPLAESGGKPKLDDLVNSWRAIGANLSDLKKSSGKN
ncbi:hypothetical protein KY308_02215, partial [Candidatus Woesearchaeota archaeon]|nr:hypothetical protein [Candidatus Woesearchaeota archaeon]